MEKWKLGLIILMFISIILVVYLFFSYSSIEDIQDIITTPITGGTEDESTTSQTQETTTQTTAQTGGGGSAEGGGGGGGGGGDSGLSITNFLLEVNSTPTESEIYITYDSGNQTFNETITTPAVLYADAESTVCLMPVYTNVTVLWYVDDGYCEYLCYDSEYSCGFVMSKNRIAKIVKGEITP
jgi:hypothetical protein